MWYVVQVCTGTEESIRTQCQKKLSPPVMKDCFIPYYEEKKRYKGEWHTRQRVLFPGYVFTVSDDIEALQEQLKTIIGLTRLLGTGGRDHSPDGPEAAIPSEPRRRRTDRPDVRRRDRK